MWGSHGTLKDSCWKLLVLNPSCGIMGQFYPFLGSQTLVTRGLKSRTFSRKRSIWPFKPAISSHVHVLGQPRQKVNSVLDREPKKLGIQIYQAFQTIQSYTPSQFLTESKIIICMNSIYFYTRQKINFF